MAATTSREDREERGREGGEIFLLVPLKRAYARMQERRKEDGEERGIAREGEERENVGERERARRGREREGGRGRLFPRSLPLSPALPPSLSLSPALPPSLSLSRPPSPSLPLSASLALPPSLPRSLSLFSLSRDALSSPSSFLLSYMRAYARLRGRRKISPPSLPHSSLSSLLVSSRRKLLPSREEAGGGKSSSLPLSPLLSSSRLIPLPRSLSRQEFPPSLPLSLSRPSLLSLSCPPSLSPALPPSLPLSLPPSLPPSFPLSLSASLPLSLSPPRTTLSLYFSFSLLIYLSMTWLPHGSRRSYGTDVASPGCQLDLEGVSNCGCARFG